MNFMLGRPGLCEKMSLAGGGVGLPSSSSCLPHGGGGGGDLRTYQEAYGSGGASQEPPVSSPITNCNEGGDNDSDDHMVVHGGVDGSSSSTGAGHSTVIEREHMFDKVVTPSDVGKLNRLVIPKQHAEKYFPLDASTVDKGLQLNFEDRNGKPWRFRYSYWNSSQSYVMTKGWSRFVKEKKLDAGDIVSFQRGVGDLGKGRLFIDWKRRPDAVELPPHISLFPHQISLHHRSINHPTWNPLFLRPPSSDFQHPSYLSRHGPFNGNPCPQPPAGPIMYLSSAAGPGVFGPQQNVGTMHAQGRSGAEHMVFESVPVVQGKAAAKRLRLFGVNMDCPISGSDECDILSSTSLPPYAGSTIVPILHHLLPHPFHSSPPSPSINNPTNHKGKASMSLDLDI